MATFETITLPILRHITNIPVPRGYCVAAATGIAATDFQLTLQTACVYTIKKTYLNNDNHESLPLVLFPRVSK